MVKLVRSYVQWYNLENIRLLLCPLLQLLKTDRCCNVDNLGRIYKNSLHGS